MLASFQTICTVIKTSTEDEYIILGSSLYQKWQADLMEKKIIELEKIMEIVENLDAHFGFFVEKLLQSAKVIVNQYMFRSSTS